jgi:hypothetical protein
VLAIRGPRHCRQIAMSLVNGESVSDDGAMCPGVSFYSDRCHHHGEHSQTNQHRATAEARCGLRQYKMALLLRLLDVLLAYRRGGLRLLKLRGGRSEDPLALLGYEALLDRFQRLATSWQL